MYPAGPVALLLLAGLLSACAGTPPRSDAAAPATCPDALAAGINITASVAQVPVPSGLSVPYGDVRLIAGVGRRLVLSAEVAQTLPRMRLVDNSVQITTLGGTLAGWARVNRPTRAGAHESIQVSGGYLRIAPFVPGHRLRTYTQVIDVLVLPGGELVSQLVLRPGRMWDEAGRPTEPEALNIVLEPIRHMSVLDVVNATATFNFRAQHRSGNREDWQCSISSDFQLVDHDSVLPRLWTLHPAKRGRPTDALALYKPTTGAFPIVFLDPATAAGFVRWLGETHATRLSGFEIGWMAPNNSTGFQLAPDSGLSGLKVKQLGSD